MFFYFYEEAYLAFQKFFIVKASNLNYIDDLLQEDYFRVFKVMKKRILRI